MREKPLRGWRDEKVTKSVAGIVFFDLRHVVKKAFAARATNPVNLLAGNFRFCWFAGYTF
jgi:hypothetical protein